MSEKAIKKIPINFFNQSRPLIDNNEGFKDIIPINWSKEVLYKKKKAYVDIAKK